MASSDVHVIFLLDFKMQATGFTDEEDLKNYLQLVEFLR